MSWENSLFHTIVSSYPHIKQENWEKKKIFSQYLTLYSRSVFFDLQSFYFSVVDKSGIHGLRALQDIFF